MSDVSGSPTLGQLCADLGPLLTDLVAAPLGVEPAVRGVTLHDPSEDVRAEAEGKLLLVIGLVADDPRLVALIHGAAAAGAVGVAVRATESWPRAPLEAAAASGIALVAIPGHIAWDELYEVIKAELAANNAKLAAVAAGPEWQRVNDLSSICETLSAIVGGTVGIEDMNGQVLAFSGGGESDAMRTASILNRRVPDEWLREIREAGVLDELFRSEDVIHVNFDNLRPRRAIAIRLGRSVLGSIWLMGSDDQLTDDADDALRRAAPVAAVEMMRQRLVVGVERRMREASTAALLWGETPAPSALEQVGLPLDEELVVLALEVVSRGTSSPAGVGLRLIDLMSVHLRAYERPAVATSVGGERGASPNPEERIYVLAAARDDHDRATLKRITEESMHQAARKLGVGLRAGIGHQFAPGGDLRLARRSAEDCLAGEPAAGSLVVFEEIHDQALTRDVDRFVAAWHGGPTRAYLALKEHDEAHGTEYVATLGCLLDCYGDTTAVGERLHLHVNTVRYRIRRIVEIAEIDFADGDARLALQLTIRAFESPR